MFADPFANDPFFNPQAARRVRKQRKQIVDNLKEMFSLDIRFALLTNSCSMYRVCISFQQQSRQHNRSSSVAIEDVSHHNDESNHHSHQRSNRNSQPIIEEPDDHQSAYRSSNHRSQHLQHHHPSSRRAQTMMNFDSDFTSPLQSMFQHLNSMQGGFSSPSHGSGNSFQTFSSSSSFYSSSSSNGGQPIIRQSHHESRNLNGLVEERSAYRDSATGVEKIGMARQLQNGKRREVIKQRNSQGQEEQFDNFINLQPEERETFDAEFKQRKSELMGSRGGSRNNTTGRLTNGSSTSSSRSQRAALPSGSH